MTDKTKAEPSVTFHLQELIQATGMPKGAFADLVDIDRHRLQGMWRGFVKPTADEVEAIESVCAAMKEDNEPSTLCHCEQCNKHRRALRHDLINMAPDAPNSVVE